MLVGSHYTRPDAGRVLNFSNAFVTFIGGNLSASFTNEVALTEDNHLVNRNGGKLSFNFTPASGIFSGAAVSRSSLNTSWNTNLFHP